MHVHIVDQYQSGQSIVHLLDPRVKAAAAGLMIILINLTPTGAWPAFPLLFAIVISLVLVSEISPQFVIYRSLIVMPFALAALTLIFTTSGTPLFQVPWVGWIATGAGMERFLSILIKSLLSVQVAIVLVMTTHFTSLLWAMQALHVPRLLITIISFMYRYLFVMADETFRMTRARQSRSATPEMTMSNNLKGKNRLAWRAQVTGWMVGQLFLRSYERSERVYNAMASRGYRGEIKQLKVPELAGRQIIMGAIPVLAIGFIVLVANIW